MARPSSLRSGGAATFFRDSVGNVGRNTLRADGCGNIDGGFIKNTRFLYTF
jgi:hypothetical protein